MARILNTSIMRRTLLFSAFISLALISVNGKLEQEFNVTDSLEHTSHHEHFESPEESGKLVTNNGSSVIWNKTVKNEETSSYSPNVQTHEIHPEIDIINHVGNERKSDVIYGLHDMQHVKHNINDNEPILLIDQASSDKAKHMNHEGMNHEGMDHGKMNHGNMGHTHDGMNMDHDNMDHEHDGMDMDHDKMGHKHDDMNMDMNHTGMHMMMYFHVGVNEVVLFEEWKITTVGGMIGSVIGIFLLGMLYEGLKYLREHLFKQYVTSIQFSTVAVTGESGRVTQVHKVERHTMLSWPHVVQTSLHVVQIVMSYFLMLIFMTYNVWLCLSVVLGAGVGYFVFGWKKASVVDITEHCH